MFNLVILGTAHPHVFDLARSARDVRGGRLVGVWDADPQRLATNAAKIGAPAIASLDEALASKPAVAIVAAVPNERVGIIERAVAAGASVLVDKPLALTREALGRIRAASERHGQQVIVYYPYRGYAAVLAAKAAVEAGEIGRLVRVFGAGPHKINATVRPDWHFSRAGNGGILIDIGSHFADVACWFAGGAPDWLCGVHGNFSHPDRPEFQDFGQLQMRFPNGVLGHLEVDWLEPRSTKSLDARMWFQGTTGKIELRFGENAAAEIWTAADARRPLTLPDVPGDDAWATQMMEALAAGKPTPIPQEDVWRVSLVTLAAFDSAAAGGKPVEGKIA